MTSTSPDIAKDLADLQTQILDLERSHNHLFTTIFVEKTLSRYEGIALIVKNGQALQALYRQEKALVKLKQIR